MIAAGFALAVFAALLFVPSLVQKARRKIQARRNDRVALVRAQMRNELLTRSLARVTDQRDRYKAAWEQSEQQRQALLEHIGDKREAAAVQALADAPAYFAAKAAREARTLDAEWLDLAMDEGLS